MSRDKLTLAALTVGSLYIYSSIIDPLGFVGGWLNVEMGSAYAAPSMQHWCGTDIFGRSVLEKVIKGAEVAMSMVLLWVSLLSPLASHGCSGWVLWGRCRCVCCLVAQHCGFYS